MEQLTENDIVNENALPVEVILRNHFGPSHPGHPHYRIYNNPDSGIHPDQIRQAREALAKKLWPKFPYLLFKKEVELMA